MTTSYRCRDDVFGPAVNCAHRFDFTLLFQNTILSILPSACLLIIGSARLWHLSRRNDVVAGQYLRWLKLVVALTLVATDQRLRNAPSIAASTLSVACAGLLCVLSFLEHARSLRPSTILIIYLGFTTLFDAVKLRTLWIVYPGSKLTAILTASTIVKGLALLLESANKSKFIRLQIGKGSSPEETCGIASLSFSFWLRALFQKGASRQISSDDLYALCPSMTADTLDKSFMKAWDDLAKIGANENTILWSCAHVLKWPLIGVIPLRLVHVALVICQPLLLRSLLQYLEESSTASKNIGKSLIGGYVLVYLGVAVSLNLYWYYHIGTITKLRACLVAAISRHTTQMNVNLQKDSQSALTLMSNDVERAVNGIRHIHDVWANVFQACLAAYILSQQVGVAWTVSVVITILTSVAVIGVSNSIGPKQGTWMEAMQARIGATSELLSSTKGVKMKGVQRLYHGVIDHLRSQDVQRGNEFRLVIACVAVLSFVPEFLSPFLTFTILIFAPSTAGSTFDAARIFTSLSSLLILTQPLCNAFQVLPAILGGIGSLKRIGDFLRSEKQPDSRQKVEASKVSTSSSVENDAGDNDDASGWSEHTAVSHNKDDAFKIINGSFHWGNKADTIHNLDVTIPRARLTMIVGPVGSGKSSLCETLLGQTEMSHGKFKMHGDFDSIAYCSQNPHLTNGSVRDNIIAYSSYDPKWYMDVIHATRLKGEIAAMPEQDDTLVGSKGSKLSGGQRQRLALARALYLRNRVVVLDDILSGLDEANAKAIFDNVLGPHGLLRQNGATVVFATHALQYLPTSDHIIALKSDGSLLVEGSYQELASTPDFEEYSKLIAQKGSGKDEEKEAEQPSTSQEGNQPTIESSKFVKKSSDLEIYVYYAKAVGILHLILLSFFSIATAAFWTYSSLWLKKWTDHATRFGNDRNGFYLGIYTMFQCLTLVLLACVGVEALTQVAARSGRKLHANMLRTVLAAPLAYLTATDSGQIINKFSQDIGLIDGELPMALMNFFLCVALAIGQVVVIVVSSPFVGLSFPVLLVILYLVQKYYLKTSKQVRNLDLETKSPLYSAFMDTISGLSTVRAFGWCDEVHAELMSSLEASQKPFYFLFMVQQWLSFVLELIVAVVAIVIVALAVSLESKGSSTGVALIQVISLNGILRQIIVTWTTMETSIGAVSRVKEFSEETPSEDDGRDETDQQLRSGWPWHGRIMFNGVSAVYQSRKEDLVLRDFNLIINAGEKIGICGRSGSGKSSLVQSLLQMLEVVSGSITIDGVDLSALPLHTIRTRINTIPQDPVFIPGSFRLNLQPPFDVDHSTVAKLNQSHEIDDDKIIKSTLEKVNLWDLVLSHGGLDATLDPKIFSQGQKQLFSLASAMIRHHHFHNHQDQQHQQHQEHQESKGEILILDEFTSGVDQKTEQKMLSLIDEVFANATVISIAHRTDTVLSKSRCNRVIVLDRGKIVKDGTVDDVFSSDSSSSSLLLH